MDQKSDIAATQSYSENLGDTSPQNTRNETQIFIKQNGLILNIYNYKTIPSHPHATAPVATEKFTRRKVIAGLFKIGAGVCVGAGGVEVFFPGVLARGVDKVLEALGLPSVNNHDTQKEQPTEPRKKRAPVDPTLRHTELEESEPAKRPVSKKRDISLNQTLRPAG